jgi:hypothetical protein
MYDPFMPCQVDRTPLFSPGSAITVTLMVVRDVGHCCTEACHFFSTCYTFKCEQIEHNGVATTLWWVGVKWSESAGISVVSAGSTRKREIAQVER